MLAHFLYCWKWKISLSKMKTCPESFWWSLFIPKRLFANFLAGVFQRIDSMQLSVGIFENSCYLRMTRMTSFVPHVLVWDILPNHATLQAMMNLKGEVFSLPTSLVWEHLFEEVQQLQKLRDCIVFMTDLCQKRSHLRTVIVSNL